MKINHILFTALLSCGLTAACTQSEDGLIPDSQGKIAKIIASIGESTGSNENVEGRANTSSDGSFSGFTTNDKIGFYATGGLTAANLPLTMKDGGFQNTNLQWTSGNAKNIFAYFPYEDNSSPVTIYSDTESKFIDILTATNASVTEGSVISLGFSHRFALLAFTRGDGFKKATNKEITITLNKKVAKTATVTYDGNNLNNCKLTVASDDTDTGIEELTSSTTYFIVPVETIEDTPLNIASISLYNDANYKVTIDYKITKTEGFVSNNKYRITVLMRNNEAVVSPIEITRWENEEVTIEKPKGIDSFDGLKNWAAAYNSTAQDNDELSKYGTYDSGDKKWTFLLLEDLDYTKATSEQAYNGIENFKDLFDGLGHTITGLSITEETGDKPLGFVRTLEGGTITRLNLNNLTLYNKGTGTVGSFAGEAKNGSSVTNCHVTGTSILFGMQEAGAIVGKIEDGATVDLTGSNAESGVFVKQNTTN